MWSGPRNLSTAMMYAFAARGDAAVWDEPFYAAYLAQTGADHPLRAEILAAHDIDPEAVARSCLGPIPDMKPVFYMKHMPHHMIDSFPLDWAKACTNVHLIRHPARVIASYAEKRADMTLADIGFVQQARIWRALPGPVIDSADIRRDPQTMLRALCTAVGIPFTERMLHWPAGPRPYDGAWAAHWYNAVHRSTGFAPAEGDLPEIPDAQRPLLESALPVYEAMRAEAITA
ncbi:MAG: HAD family hydrolase [Octadecabacter sp.]|nr:HAD family hydrolase [Octadecabacter sp.]